jgi:hypothetical protein
VNLLRALTGCVSVLTRKHDTLLRVIFGIKLWTCPKVCTALLHSLLLVTLLQQSLLSTHLSHHNLLADLALTQLNGPYRRSELRCWSC